MDPAAAARAHAIAVSWSLRHACASNAQLAVFANVCRGWRAVAARAVADAARADGEHRPPLAASAGDGEGGGATPADEEMAGGTVAAVPRSSSLRRLLLTDMARELVARRMHDDHGRADATKTRDDAAGECCLAWFAPSGIRTASVVLDDEEEDEGPAEDGAWLGRRHGRRRARQRTVTCCPEWRGYREAAEVLVPFGYAEAFVADVLTMATGADVHSIKGGRSPSPTKTKSPSSAASGSPTYAVRGATVCVPEGYCPCVEDARIDDWVDDSDRAGRPARDGAAGLSPAQRERKRASLARALLPRVVASTRRKEPLLHRYREAAADENAPWEAFAWERRQRAVQFLNSDRSQAVRLITPKFPRPCAGPVTVFVVGIATEEGCFLSGRSERFELGHLYPTTARDVQFDVAPVAIATGKGGQRHAAAATGSGDSEAHRCLCEFNSGDPFAPGEVRAEEPQEDCIYRGSTGPGRWHCYVAVFDGANSCIRVDGAVEPQQKLDAGSDEEEESGDHPANAARFVGSGILDGLSIGSDHSFDMSLCYGEIEGECGQGAIAEVAIFKGAMATADIETLEQHLMQKHGLLSASDKSAFLAREQRESALARPLRLGSPAQEDEWRRQAHALIAQPRPWRLAGEALPLRAAAGHPAVAWRRTNEVTGSPVRIARIGARRSNGSSDW